MAGQELLGISCLARPELRATWPSAVAAARHRPGQRQPLVTVGSWFVGQRTATLRHSWSPTSGGGDPITMQISAKPGLSWEAYQKRMTCRGGAAAALGMQCRCSVVNWPAAAPQAVQQSAVPSLGTSQGHQRWPCGANDTQCPQHHRRRPKHHLHFTASRHPHFYRQQT